MAYGVVHFFPGGTREQYEASLAAVHPDGGKGLPDGQVFHAGGETSGGWAIVAVHELKASWEKFRDETLVPSFRVGTAGGFTVPPEERAFDVYNLRR